jgi:hypothetical protein
MRRVFTGRAKSHATCYRPSISAAWKALQIHTSVDQGPEIRHDPMVPKRSVHSGTPELGDCNHDQIDKAVHTHLIQGFKMIGDLW